MGVDAGPFEGELVVLLEFAPAGLVAAQERLAAGADDERVGRVVAAAGKDRALHGGKDVGLVGAGADEGKGCLERHVGELGGPAHAPDFGGALDQAQPADDVRGVGEIGEGLQTVVEQPAVGAVQSVRVVFDADAAAEQVHVVEKVPEVAGRIGVGPVDPNDDTVDGRGLAGLAQIGRTCQQRHLAVGLDHQALEEAEAEAVEAGEPVHALLREEQHGVQLFLLHRLQQASSSVGIFVRGELQGHLIAP